MAEENIPKNVSSWKLNNAEKAELERRVAAGESRETVKYELQLAKARACEARKHSAAAVVQNVARPPAGRAVAGAAAGASPEPSGKASPNHDYYAELQACQQTILKALPGLESERPLPLTGDSGAAANQGVQDPFDPQKAAVALKNHSLYRCSVSLWSINLMASATPDIPMSMRRVKDLATFFYGEDGTKPSYMTGRQVEVMVSNAELPAQPEQLQMVSPEELAHAILVACAAAVKQLG